MRERREATGWELVAALAGEPGISIQEEWLTRKVLVKVRGNSFLVLAGGEVALRLPETRTAALARDSLARPASDVGEGWVVVPPLGAAAWLELAREAYRFVLRNGGR